MTTEKNPQPTVSFLNNFKRKSPGNEVENPQVLKFAIYFISGKPIAEKAGKR